jgi:lysophospholipase L1-like esterase
MSISATCTGFSIVYTSGPAASTYGSFYYAVDGGTTTSVDATHATVLGGRLQTVSGLSLASHTVTITPHSDHVPIEGIIFYNGNETTGIRVWEGGHSGITAASYVDASFPHWIDLLPNIAPDLAIIMLGRNEWVTGVSAATFIANLTTLIANVRATATPAPSILLVAEMQGNYTPGPLWSTYVDAIAALVASDGNLAYVDLNPAFGGYTVPPSGPLYNADLKHPNDAGNAEIASELMALIG